METVKMELNIEEMANVAGGEAYYTEYMRKGSPFSKGLMAQATWIYKKLFIREETLE